MSCSACVVWCACVCVRKSEAGWIERRKGAPPSLAAIAQWHAHNVLRQVERRLGAHGLRGAELAPQRRETNEEMRTETRRRPLHACWPRVDIARCAQDRCRVPETGVRDRARPLLAGDRAAIAAVPRWAAVRGAGARVPPLCLPLLRHLSARVLAPRPTLWSPHPSTQRTRGREQL